MKARNLNMHLTTYLRARSDGPALLGKKFEPRRKSKVNSFWKVFSSCTSRVSIACGRNRTLYKIKRQLQMSYIRSWYNRNHGEGGLYEFVTKRWFCTGPSFLLAWVQTEIGSVMRWKYPSTSPVGEKPRSSSFPLAALSDYQVSNAGSKMTHTSKNAEVSFHQRVYH